MNFGTGLTTELTQTYYVRVKVLMIYIRPHTYNILVIYLSINIE